LEGGLVNSSRAVIFPDISADSAGPWERALDRAIDQAIDELGSAVARTTA
jgi:hypothetical protein